MSCSVCSLVLGDGGRHSDVATTLNMDSCALLCGDMGWLGSRGLNGGEGDRDPAGDVLTGEEAPEPLPLAMLACASSSLRLLGDSIVGPLGEVNGEGLPAEPG